MWDGVTTSTGLDIRSHELRELRAALRKQSDLLDELLTRQWHIREEIALLRERLARLEARGG